MRGWGLRSVHFQWSRFFQFLWILAVALGIQSCNPLGGEGSGYADLYFTPGYSGESPTPADPQDQSPVASSITPASFNEDTENTITLSYTDPEGDQADSCATSDLQNITVTEACACAAGVCAVKVKGTPDYHGAASLKYTVTAGGLTSNVVTATLTINSVDDAPVVNDITPSLFMENTPATIYLDVSEVGGDAITSCSVTDLDRVTITSACTCSVGVCQVGVVGALDYRGDASFKYTAISGGATSLQATASLKINPYVLTEYPGAKAAYSFRKLRDAYAGYAIQVRRSSDSTTKNIGFTSTGYLDTADLLSFCGAGSCYIKTWYDQVGSKDATATVAAYQPRIVNSGSLDVENSRPTMYFDGTNDYLSTSLSNLMRSISLFVFYKRLGSHSNIYNNFTCVVCGTGGYNGMSSHWGLFYNDSPSFCFQVRTDNSYTPTAISKAVPRVDGGHIHSAVGVEGNFMNYRVDQAITADVDISSLHEATVASNFKFGQNIGGFTFKGNLSEVIIYDSDQSVNRDAIEDDINLYFGVYP